MAKAAATKVDVMPKHEDVLLAPVITEKATLASQHNQITFWVAKQASKPEIKEAVETLFKVTVTGVNTLNVKGKTKRFRGVMGTRPARKKAIVTLKEGDSVDVMTGV